MSKKHFIALANTIREFNSYNRNAPFTQEQIIALALFSKRQNSNFNMQRWLNFIAGACGPNGGAR